MERTPFIGADSVEAKENRKLVQAFWRYEAWCHARCVDEDEDEQCGPPGDFGYAVVGTIARLVGVESPGSAKQLWLPVLSLGPKAHYLIGEFLRQWLHQVSEATDMKAFGSRWRSMIEFALYSDWDTGRLGYKGARLLRQLLGFSDSGFITRNAGYADLIRSLSDLYDSWAEKRLHIEDDFSEFCAFLRSKLGEPLRMTGRSRSQLPWPAGMERPGGIERPRQATLSRC